MKVIEIQAPGGPEVLQLAERPDPVPQAGEVLIRVQAAGLNRADLLQRQGKYPPPPGAPEWPGMEVAGRVIACGPGVHEFEPGDSVCALVSGGGYAESCIAPVAQTLPIPKGLDAVAAAAIPEAAFTVWNNIFDICRVSPGESVLVHGGSSGIGVMALQLLSAFGHTVLTTAGTAAKCRACEALGASRAINYNDENFVTVVRQTLGDKGVDVILDMVGGDYIARDLDCIADGGRICVIATQRGSRTTVNLAQLMRRQVILTGSTLRSRPVAYKERIKAALLVHVWPLIEQARIRPVIDRTFALRDAALAHAAMERGEHIGKIILTC